MPLSYSEREREELTKPVIVMSDTKLFDFLSNIIELKNERIDGTRLKFAFAIGFTA